MRPEDVVLANERTSSAAPVPIDVALESLDAELVTAGAHARRMVHGHRQPTRYFTLGLRDALLDVLASEADPVNRR